MILCKINTFHETPVCYQHSLQFDFILSSNCCRTIRFWAIETVLYKGYTYAWKLKTSMATARMVSPAYEVWPCPLTYGPQDLYATHCLNVLNICANLYRHCSMHVEEMVQTRSSICLRMTLTFNLQTQDVCATHRLTYNCSMHVGEMARTRLRRTHITIGFTYIPKHTYSTAIVATKLTHRKRARQNPDKLEKHWN